MRASVKQLNGKKWETLNLEEVIGKSIAEIMSKSDKVMVGALLDDNNVPCFFVTNDKEQYEIYIKKAYTLMVDDLILLMGTETIPSIPIAHAIATVFPDTRFEVTIDDRPIDDKKKWW